MIRLRRVGAKDARRQLHSVLTEAEKGYVTVITRHGRDVAAVVPLERLSRRKQKSLTGLAGSGKGLWGKDSGNSLRRLRREWRRYV